MLIFLEQSNKNVDRTFEQALDEYQRHDYAGEKRNSGDTREACHLQLASRGLRREYPSQ